MGRSVQARPKSSSISQAGIVDFVHRRIGNASFFPKFQLLARVGNSVVLSLCPIDKLRLRTKGSLHDVIAHGCAGNWVSVEPTRGNATTERVARKLPNVRRYVVPIETPDCVRKRPTDCGAVFRREILPRAVVQSVARRIESQASGFKLAHEEFNGDGGTLKKREKRARVASVQKDSAPVGMERRLPSIVAEIGRIVAPV